MVARGSGRLFVDESGVVVLREGTAAGTEVRITPGAVPDTDRWQFTLVTVDAPFAKGWSGVATPNKPATFDLGDGLRLLVSGKPEGDAR